MNPLNSKEIKIKLEKDIEAEESLIFSSNIPSNYHFDESNLIKHELPVDCDLINENSTENSEINFENCGENSINNKISENIIKNSLENNSIVNNQNIFCKSYRNAKKSKKLSKDKINLIDRTEKLQSKKRKIEQVENHDIKRIKIEPNHYFEDISAENVKILQNESASSSENYFEITEFMQIEEFKDEEMKIKNFSIKLIDIYKEINHKNLFEEIDLNSIQIIENSSEFSFKNQEFIKENNKPKFKFSNNLYHCMKCPSTFNKKISLDRHQMIHLAPKFTCSICNIKFKKKKSFENHQCNICFECNRQFESRAKLANHIRNIHTDESKLELFSCDICGKYYKYYKSIIRHVLSHRSEADINCNHCEKKLKSEIALQDHVRSCHAEKLTTCKICHKKMKPQCIYQHMKLVHTKIRNFHCNLCEASFKTKEKLARHLQTHDKKFNCEICERKFSSNYELNEHLMRHENPNIFSCKICKKSFSTRTSLNTHSKLHKNLERNLKCEHCDFVTHKIQSLKYHLTTHEKKKEKLKIGKNWLKCEKCDAILKTKASLWGHYKKVHQTERFECDFCGLKIKTKFSMKIHLDKKHKTI
ncbi:hypothetical protein PVAND_015922 [Polypedilum vanderplanki]|uniref:Zinc finger protein n=1 Tax=Polypedilum vanderplanki TaxID=319348 RepID=A0A9J6BEM9_POLVA|nr:hypothetical protein PVAND_015922 [Polypedilum vanderplanki]